MGMSIFSLRPFKLLIERLDKHKDLVATGKLDSDVNLRYKEFYEIKKLTLNSGVILDSFSEDFEKPLS